MSSSNKTNKKVKTNLNLTLSSEESKLITEKFGDDNLLIKILLAYMSNDVENAINSIKRKYNNLNIFNYCNNIVLDWLSNNLIDKQPPYTKKIIHDVVDTTEKFFCFLDNKKLIYKKRDPYSNYKFIESKNFAHINQKNYIHNNSILDNYINGDFLLTFVKVSYIKNNDTNFMQKEKLFEKHSNIDIHKNKSAEYRDFYDSHILKLKSNYENIYKNNNRSKLGKINMFKYEYLRIPICNIDISDIDNKLHNFERIISKLS